MLDPHLSEEGAAVTARMLRQFAVLCVVVFGGLGVFQGLIRHHAILGAVLGAIALVVGPLGLVKPEAIRPAFVVMTALTAPIGRVVSLVLIAVLFFGLFTPFGWVFRLIRRDTLALKRPSRASHWSAKPAVDDVRKYLRQF